MPGCAEDHTREGPLHYNTAMEGADEAVFVREKATKSVARSAAHCKNAANDPPAERNCVPATANPRGR